jgi:hypothetical protein
MRLIRFAIIVLSLSLAHAAHAQRAERIGFVGTLAPSGQGSALLPQTTSPASPILAPARSVMTAPFATKAADLPGNSGMPRWLRWGLVGAIGGAALFVLADGLNSGNHSVGSSLLAGAATGFVVVGGGVLVYDALCSNRSGRSGAC